MLRHQIIRRYAAQQAGSPANAAVSLWAQLASKIVAIVGEGGFNAIYARSVFIAHRRFAWLSTAAVSPPADCRFAELKANLEGQLSEQANEASIHLLVTFTDVLASLIGEELVTNILYSAWESNAIDSADKRLKNG